MNDPQAVLRQALELGEEERWAEMAELLAGALDEGDDDPYLLCWLGVAEGELGNDGAAYDAFRRCIEQEPSDPHILALAGSGLAQFDDPDAEAALRAAALSAPDLPLARLNYGAYLARAGLFDEALGQLGVARDLVPEDPVVRAELGAAHVLRGDLDRGVAELEEALILAPDDSWTRVILGLVLVEIERMDDAAEALVHAARERPDDAEALIIGALAAAATGWLDPAAELLARAEYAAERADVAVLAEAETAIDDGPDAARRILRQTLGPTALRERLAQPI
jgi:tetratricopeptide (TPR) repeat protein